VSPKKRERCVPDFYTANYRGGPLDILGEGVGVVADTKNIRTRCEIFTSVFRYDFDHS
jgi:hypothetical protein